MPEAPAQRAYMERSCPPGQEARMILNSLHASKQALDIPIYTVTITIPLYLVCLLTYMKE